MGNMFYFFDVTRKRMIFFSLAGKMPRILTKKRIDKEFSTTKLTLIIIGLTAGSGLLIPATYASFHPVTTGEIADDTIRSADISNTAGVASVDIINGQVGSADIGTVQVASVDILDGTITSQDIASGTIPSESIPADNSVTSAKIADGEVKSVDIGNDEVFSADIVDDQVATVDLANGAVTREKIANGAIPLTIQRVEQSREISGGLWSLQTPCPSGTTLLSGGYQIVGVESRLNTHVHNDRPVGNSWVVVMTNPTNNPGTLTVIAICANNPLA
jgi:hypothetical protein